ncbi:hypothetical protein D3C72_1240110 [compost metagenome]
MLARKSPSCSWPAYDGKPGSVLAPRDQPLTGKPTRDSSWAEATPRWPRPMMPTRMSAATRRESNSSQWRRDWLSTMRLISRVSISALVSTNSAISVCVRAVTMRAIGRWRGSAGSARMWSTPAPALMMSFRLGKVARRPASGAQTSA